MSYFTKVIIDNKPQNIAPITDDVPADEPAWEQHYEEQDLDEGEFYDPIDSGNIPEVKCADISIFNWFE